MKPANIKLKPDGTVKMLDFGPQHSPTLTMHDVAPDGRHIVAVLLAEESGKDRQHLHLVFLLNFFDEVKRRVK